MDNRTTAGPSLKTDNRVNGTFYITYKDGMFQPTTERLHAYMPHRYMAHTLQKIIKIASRRNMLLVRKSKKPDYRLGITHRLAFDVNITDYDTARRIHRLHRKKRNF